MSACESLIVAAIDFGTTYSGYAFSFKDRPNEIQTNPNWIAGSAQLISLKCPTSVLLRPDKTFHSFGFEAENKYSDLAEDEEHHDWYLFRRFKMILHETTNLKLDTSVEDISGKKAPAIDIFAHSVSFLKNHLWKTIQSRTLGILQTDILYVITIPAIWDPKAKQFMRSAANKADIPDSQITFALEPEAASLWCQIETDDKLSNLSEPLTKYMVVDLGGGTADITVHQKMEDGGLREIHKATGGAWGGNEVDKCYLRMLEDLVKSEVMEKFKQTEMTDYFDLLRDFEIKKRSIKRDTEGKITFKIPASIRELAESNGVTISWAGDKLRIEKVAAKALFASPLKQLINHIEKLFEHDDIHNIDAILLVGGFGECDLVKEAFEQHFANMNLVIPKEAGLVVLKGAVRFGHLKSLVKSRIARFTIGIEVWPMFQDHHDEAKKVICNGQKRCKNVFRKIIEVGEEIPMDKTHEQRADVAYKDQETSVIKIFSSKNRNVTYTTEPGCQELGRLVIELPKSEKVSDKKHTIYYYFGDTEIHVRVKLTKTNEVFEKWIDCFLT